MDSAPSPASQVALNSNNLLIDLLPFLLYYRLLKKTTVFYIFAGMFL